MSKTAKGFTLIEILVVIGIIAVLAGIVLVAINPARQFAQANNSQRTSNVNAVLNAVGQYLADNRGQFTGCLSGVSASSTVIATTGGVDLSCLVPSYLPALPFDPTGSTTTTRYYIAKDANNRVTVSAPYAELGTTISVTR